MVRTKSSKANVLSKNTKSAMAINTVFITHAECRRLLEREDWTGSLDEDSYTVFCGLNTWCGLFQDITGRSGSVLANFVKLNGLKGAIEHSESYRLQMVSGSWDKTNFWFPYVQEVTSENLTLVGQLRRLRIVGKEEGDELRTFMSGNVKCGRHNASYKTPLHFKAQWRCDDNNFTFLPLVEEDHVFPLSYDPEGSWSYDEWISLTTFTPGFILDEARFLWSLIFKEWEQDTSLFVLPPGVTYEGARTYFEKFKIVSKQQVWLRDHGVNIPFLPADAFSTPAPYCRYNLVPKTFKSRRGIAPEPVSRQVLAYQIDSGLRKCLKRFGCDLTDQSRNQRFASNLANATEDLTAASDSISLFLVENISSETPLLKQRLLDVRSKGVWVGDKCIINHRYATMGNACTFAVESAIFLIASVIAMELTYNKRFNTVKKLMKACERISIYGDDCVIPSDCHENFVLVCQMLGFSVNKEKSYATGDYRESCGVEWYAGKNVTGSYWPRGLSNEPYAELIGLQHKYVDYPTANSFLIGVILDVFPEVTQSAVGSPYQDIWTYQPIIKYDGRSPYAMFIYSLSYFRKVNSMRLKNSSDLMAVAEFYEKKPDNYGFRDLYLYPQWDTVLSNFAKAPHDDNYEVHTTISSSSEGKIPSKLREQVEHLAYLLTIGNGIEKVNNSPYTREEDTIRNRRDLLRKRKVKIVNKRYPS